LTDKEKALMNAIEVEFPFTKCMLCIWHVNKNVLAKARAFLRRDTLSLFRDNDPQFLPRLKEKEKAIWMSVVYAGTQIWRKLGRNSKLNITQKCTLKLSCILKPNGWNLIQHVGFSMPTLHPTFTLATKLLREAKRPIGA